MSFFRHLKFWLPVVLILLFELLFQLGGWEPFTREDSYAGRSVRLKSALKAFGPGRIDFITLGNSRALYGLDHQQIAKVAEREGYVHVAAALPGAHFMTYRVLTDWLQTRALNLKGGLLAFSVGEMAHMNNGAYELAIVRPFRTMASISKIRQHIPWQAAEPNTYGVYSALFGYNQDIRDLILHPLDRIPQMWRYWRHQSGFQINFTPQVDNDMCELASADGDYSDSAADEALEDANICLEAKQTDPVLDVPDYSVYLKSPLPPEMSRLKASYHEFLSHLPWRSRPIVILMPEHDYLIDNIYPKQIHAWAMSILKPLAEAGAIRLYDFTYFFFDQGKAECSAFFDFYHLNQAGRDRLMGHLLPILEKELYGSANL